MRVTLDMIAERAKVSPSTVSRVLNSYEFVDEDTRTRVWAIARELGYPLDKLRRPPPTSRSVLISGMGQLGTPPATPEFVTSVLHGAEMVFAEHGVAVRSQTVPAQERGTALWQYFKSTPGVEGIVLLGGTINPDVLHPLKQAQIPLVIAGGHSRQIEIASVMADYTDGILQAVDHLAERGRRRIALLNTLDYTVTSYEKYKGYRLALTLHDFAFDPALTLKGEPSAESGFSLMHTLLESGAAFDAVLCADDYMAVGALRALQERGRTVPDDVAVIGFHDYSVAAFTNPPLTSIALDMREMGIIAARLLVHLIEHEPLDNWFILQPTHLIPRATT